MIRSVRLGLAAIAALALLGTAAVAPAAAQDLVAGIWAGTITGPQGQSFDVDFEVSGEGEDLGIMMIPPPEAGAEAVALEEIELAGGMLMFVLPFPAARVMCELESDDEGAYEGECADEEGESGHLRLVPPA